MLRLGAYYAASLMGFLQSPDPARKLAQAYGIRGLFSPEIVPSLQPVTIIDDLTGGISNVPQRTAVGTATALAGALNISVVRFETQPGLIARVERLNIITQSAQRVKVNFGSTVAAPATVATTSAYTDGRLRLEGQTPQAILSHDDYLVGPSTNQMDLPGQSSSNLIFMQELNWVVGSATSFDFIEIFNTVVNNFLIVGLQWTEFDAAEVR